MKPIKKLNKLKHVEAFIQADYLKGYEYVDKAGELVNKFYLGNTPPKFSMNLDGLIILQPDTKTKEIKISPLSFWAHFLIPDSLDQIGQLFEKKLELVHKVIKPEDYSRLGWRNYFILEVDTQENDSFKRKFVPSEKFDFKQSIFSIKTGLFDNNFNIVPASKKDDPKSPAILFDVDTFIQYGKSVNIQKIINDLKDMALLIRGEQFLEIINQIIDQN